MNIIAAALVLFSVLVPVKTWFAPDRPVQLNINADQPVRLVMLDFNGKLLEPAVPAQVNKPRVVDIHDMYPQISNVGTYVMFAVPSEKGLQQFVGTPVVVQSLAPGRFGGPLANAATVIKLSPLVFAKMDTDSGPIKMAFWYDSAPNTIASFLALSQGGFYDGLTFHRVVPGFVIQGGDPTSTGFGGPGYNVQAEFNDRNHDEGVLSMARTGDPLEGKGVMPRAEFANSAGSQFFICLSRDRTSALDRKYTAFGKVVDGLDAVKKIAAAPLTDERTGKPKQPLVIRKITVVPVTAADNPYDEMLKLETAESRLQLQTTQPTTQPTAMPSTVPMTIP